MGLLQLSEIEDLAMSSFEWAELDVVSATIARLEAERLSAKSTGNAGREKRIAYEIDRAMRLRDNLVSHITAAISRPDGVATR